MMSRDSLRSACVCVASAAALAVGAGPAGAQTSGSGSRTGQGPHVRVELIADRAVPGPGMQLGLKFDLDPDWHIYWQNPGDSGGPPEVTWSLPAGTMAAGIEWPAPERIDIGGLVNYGYHNKVVLPVPVAVAADVRIPRDFTVRASVRWMACANLCVPGKADLVMRFPLSAAESSQVAAWKAEIEAARGLVPKPAPASWKASARIERGRVCRRRPDRIARGSRRVLPARVEPGERLSGTVCDTAGGWSPRGAAQVEPAREGSRLAPGRACIARRTRVHD